MTGITRSNTLSCLFLPAAGEQFLCETTPEGSVQVLARAPGFGDARYKISSDGKYFGVLDASHKRFAVYELTYSEPWMRRVVPPTTLPRRCFAHDFILHEGMLIVGGASNSHENIWVLDYTLAHQTSQPWSSLDIPERVRKKGKSIDLLYVLGQTLVAVDNVILPKWFVFYTLKVNELPKPVGIHTIRVESAFERISHGAEGEQLYALFSRGVHSGVVSSFVQLYFKDDIARAAQKCALSAVLPEQHPEHDDDGPLIFRPALDRRPLDRNQSLAWRFHTHMQDYSHNLRDTGSDEHLNTPAEPKNGLPGAAVCAMVFCGDFLFLAMGKEGVWAANTRDITVTRKIGSSSRFRKVRSRHLKNIFGFSKITGNLHGVFAVGHTTEVADFEWHSLKDIEFAI